MARLYTKLKNYELASKTLRGALSKLDLAGGAGDGEGKGQDDGDFDASHLTDKDVKALGMDVKTLLLLAEVHKGEGDKAEMKEVLLRARKVQR
jgi:hypothetical protein